MNATLRDSTPPDQVFRAWFLTALAIANGAAAFEAARDGSLGALVMIAERGPMMNLLFTLVGVAATFPLRRKRKEMAIGLHIGIVVGADSVGYRRTSSHERCFFCGNELISRLKQCPKGARAKPGSVTPRAMEGASK